MTARYALAPVAALDLTEIWRYIKNQSSAADGRPGVNRPFETGSFFWQTES